MRVRLVGIAAVAIGAGLTAGFIALKLVNQRPEPVRVVENSPRAETAEVLVAARDIAMGNRVQDGDLRWATWPKDNLPDHLLLKSEKPDAAAQMNGSIARVGVLAGEPVRAERMMKADRGFMSVILSPGMRAIAIEVKAQSTAGGFILPNDHVDVILTRQAKAGAGQDSVIAETILTNVRVLAIDQTITEKDNQPAVIARETATLELSPKQAEMMAAAQQLGSVSLALRALRDAEGGTEMANQDESSTVKVVRFGVTTRTTTSAN
jgi:pilus assembly protein CpaB